MLRIRHTGDFKGDYKRVIKQGKNKLKIANVIEALANEAKLPESWNDHKLKNTKDWKDVRELHIEPDWILIYKIEKDDQELRLIRTGSHSELFK